jgi:hypothetical protein
VWKEYSRVIDTTSRGIVSHSEELCSLSLFTLRDESHSPNPEEKLVQDFMTELDSQRQGEMMGALKKLVPSHRSKHQYLMGEGVGGKKISPDISLHGVPALEIFEAVEQPSEPTEIDNPAPCPPPENSILQDGLIWRERVARNCRRQIERNSTWQEGDGVGLTGKVSNLGSSNMHKTSLFMAQSAPEISVSKMLM